MPRFFQSCASQTQLSIYHTRDLTQLPLISLIGAESSAQIDGPQMSCHVACIFREGKRWEVRKGLLEPRNSHGGFASFQLLACTGNCLYEWIGRLDLTRVPSHQSLFLCLFLLLSSSFLSGVYRIWGLQQAAISPCSLRRDFSAADHSSHLGLYMHMLC